MSGPDDTPSGGDQDISVDQLNQIDELCDRFETALQADENPTVAGFVSGLSGSLASVLTSELGRIVKDYQTRSAMLADPEDGHIPEAVGRYRILSILGEGGFGRVFLAMDDELERKVVVKVARDKSLRPDQLKTFVSEARAAAALSHPAIAHVLDVGSTESEPFFIVSQHVPGRTLAAWLRDGPFKTATTIDIIARLANALHHAHQSGLFHRDIKPANILIGDDYKPYLLDFGLALRESDSRGPHRAIVGTPAYMSPEQARGETHRVDGRSDIFSLGVVLYRMLVGKKPFRGDSTSEILEQVISYEPRPLRQHNDTIPRELERICARAMAKRMSHRYPIADDLAHDLRSLQSTMAARKTSTTTQPVLGDSSKPELSTKNATPESGSSSYFSAPVVPPGLRSFEAEDASSFLQLLPGPRSREGLPQSVAFWKTRIEHEDADRSFTVGLVFGPSGCGKSSLLKAGLLPRLAPRIRTAFIEATAADTEETLINRIRIALPRVNGSSLRDVLANVRGGEGLASDEKLLIVVDQFEQWLHGNSANTDSDLAVALRQCDGERLQCILTVRDDFWMAVTRFMDDLEVEIVQGRNFAVVDLFPLHHAEKVLSAFGQAYGDLPHDRHECSAPQVEFISGAVESIAEDGKVICVRLSLFAQMMKGRSWSAETLRQFGGATGIGVAFLDETFVQSSANPTHRRFQSHVRSVLQTLLPPAGTDIRGHRRTEQELRDAAGCRSDTDFKTLLGILDRETRLITPGDGEAGEEQSAARTWQLTHDYLVPSVREWLSNYAFGFRLARTVTPGSGSLPTQP